MVNYISAIRLAGILQLLIVGANIFIPKKLGYRENLEKVSPIVRQIFVVHAAYIIYVLLVFSALCLLFPHELAGGTSLGRFISGSMALFWGPRVFIQRFYYADEAKKLNRVADMGFTLVFIYLAAVFTLATLKPWI